MTTQSQNELFLSAGVVRTVSASSGDNIYGSDKTVVVTSLHHGVDRIKTVNTSLVSIYRIKLQPGDQENNL